ncbi:MAG: alpha/beta hydrolase-fold protein [Bacteroidota bacterium]
MKFRTIQKSDARYSAEGIQLITVKSPALKGRGDVSVYVPEQARGLVGLPVYVLLHGVYGSHWSWSLQGGAHVVLQNLIDEEKIAPAILVMPSDGLWGDGSGYASYDGRDFEKWIGEEAPALIRQEVDTVNESSLFFIGGLSMGGYGAFRVGLKYPETFSGISGHSSMTSLDQMSLFVEEDWAEKLKNIPDPSILDCIGEHIPPMRFDCGTEDELISYNRELDTAFREKGFEHIYEEFPGGHSWEYWHEHVGATYQFFDRIASNG